MSGSINRRLARIERGNNSAGVDVVAALDAAQTMQIDAMRRGAHANLEASHEACRKVSLEQLDADASTRRLSPLADRLRDAYRLVAYGVPSSADERELPA